MRRHLKAAVALSALLLLTSALGVTLASATAPVVAIEPVPSASYTSAQVAGKVNPEDQETSYRFQYSASPETEGWSDGAFQGPLPAGAGETSVSDTITGLKPNTQYFFRLVAESADGQSISAEPNPSATTLIVGPPTVSIDPPTAVTGTTAHFSGTINPEAPAGNPSAFDVGWRFECTPACPGLPQESIPADSSSHTVEVAASGLQPNTAYEVSLVATNAGGTVSAGPENFSTEEAAPEIFSYPTLGPTQASATIAGLVNPNNSNITDCHFAFGSTAAYGQNVPCTETPTGGDATIVTAALSGLSSNSTYHYRLHVTTPGGSDEGTDQSFFTFPGPQSEGSCPNEAIRALQGVQALPECRAFEQVTPVNKAGADFVSGQPFQSSTEPGAFSFATNIGLPGSRTSLAKPVYRALRGTTSWSTSFYDLPQNNAGVPILKATVAVSPDLSESISATESPVPLTPSTEPGAAAVYQQNLDTGALALIAQKSPAPDFSFVSSFLSGNPGPVWGWDADFGHVSFESSLDLGSGVPAETNNVWQYDHGEVSLVSRMPDGAPSPTGGFQSLSLGGAVQDQNWVSADGSRTFFFAPQTKFAGSGYIYVRENGASTRLLSYSQRQGADPTVPVQASFEAASRDGRYAVFSSNAPLTDEVPATDVTRLYRYDLDTDGLIALTPPGYRPGGGEPQVLRVSDDGKRVYFYDSFNLYLWENGESRFIAPLNADVFQGFGTSADGRYMQYASYVPPLGMSPQIGASCPDSTGRPGPCLEVYGYDAVAETITCLSCSPSGTSSGNARISKTIGPWSTHTPLSVLPDGTSFFDTPNALVPEDVNRVSDVYEWKQGQLRLMSSGVDRQGSEFLEVDPSGTDVYFATVGRLVSQDVDTQRDVYTSRRGGGLPAQNTVAGEGVECAQESCQGIARPAGPKPAIGSGGLQGNGNAGRPASLRIKGPKQIKGAKGKVEVRVEVAGTVRISGNGLRAVTRRVKHAGSYRLGVALTRAARRSLAKRGSKGVAVVVRFEPSEGETAERSLAVRFVRPAGSSKGGS